MNTSVNNAAPVYQAVDISNMDLESALMAVQGERAQLLEDRLMEQMQMVQNKNSEIQRLNSLKNELSAISAKSTDPAFTISAEDRTKLEGLREPGEVEGLSPERIEAYKQEYLAANPPSTAEANGCYVQIPAGSKISQYNGGFGAFGGVGRGTTGPIGPNIDSTEMGRIVGLLDNKNNFGDKFIKQEDLTKLGITAEMVQEYRDGLAPGDKRLAAADTYAYAKNDEAIAAGQTYSSNEAPIKGLNKVVNGVFGLSIANKGELDKVIADLSTQIDGLTNSQQMDMLKLQSLSNKRNEAYEIMTNFMKKMADSKSSIIGNLR